MGILDNELIENKGKSPSESKTKAVKTSELNPYEDLLKKNDEALKEAGYFTISKEDREKAEAAAERDAMSEYDRDAFSNVRIEDKISSIKAPLDLLKEVTSKTTTVVERQKPEKISPVKESSKYVKESNGINLESVLYGKWKTYREPYDVVYPDYDELKDLPPHSNGELVCYYNSNFTRFASNKSAFESEREYACRQFDRELKEGFSNGERNRMKQIIEASPDIEPGQKWLDYLHNNYVEISIFKDNHILDPDSDSLEMNGDLLYVYSSDFDQVEATLRRIYRMPKSS